MIIVLEILIKKVFTNLNKSVHMIVNLQKIEKNGVFNLTISDKSICLYDLNENIEIV